MIKKFFKRTNEYLNPTAVMPPLKSVSASKGNALLMFIPLVFFLLVFGYALISRTSADHTQSFRLHRQNVAMYLAEGSLKASMEYINRNLNGSLKKKFIDSSSSTVFYLDKEFPDLKKNIDSLISEMPGAQLVRLTAAVSDAKKFSGAASEKNSKEKQFTLVFTCEVSYLDINEKLTITRDIKIVSIEPPARDFTLYTNAAPADPYEINKGAYLFCFNRDENNGKIGSVRLKGKNIINLGIYDGLNLDIINLTNLMPVLIPSRLGGLLISALTLGVPFPGGGEIDTLITGLNLPLKTISFALKLPDPHAAAPQAPEKDSKYKRARVSLVGMYVKTTSGENKNIHFPAEIYGDVYKRYGYCTIEKKLDPITSTSGIPMYKFVLGPLTEVIGPYRYGDKDSPSSLVITHDSMTLGSEVQDSKYYKQRAFLFKDNINTKTLKPLEYGDAIYANGIIFTHHAEIGSDSQPFVYNGKMMIVSDNEMNIKHNVEIKKEGISPVPGQELKSITSNLSLVLNPDKIGTAFNNPLGFSRQKGSNTSLNVEANIFSYNSIREPKQDGITNESTNTTQYNPHDPKVCRNLKILGNLAVEKLNITNFFAYVRIFYRDRLKTKDELEHYVINMSPIYSAWFEDGGRGK